MSTSDKLVEEVVREIPFDADRSDWLWNTLTALALALTASFLVNIYRAVSIGEITVAEIFVTLVQGVGVALLSSGVVSPPGKGTIAGIFNSLRIHPRLHGKAFFGFSILLLLTVVGVTFALEDRYFREGEMQYRLGDLDGATVSYLQGLQLNPRADGRRNELGEVYESLGDLPEAMKNYHGGAEEGDPMSLNNLGRASLHDTPVVAEAYLLLGLQRLETQKEPDRNLLYQLHRNLGWALMQQEKFAQAEVYLLEAITLDEEIGTRREGGGMASCFLAQTRVLEDRAMEAEPLWRSCLEQALPEFLHEYRWFLEVGQHDLAYCLDSSQVVGGFEGTRTLGAEERCGKLFRGRAPIQDG